MNTIARFLATLALAFVMAAAAGSAQASDHPEVDFSKAFAPDIIGPGSVSTLTFTIDNTAATPVTDLAFTDTLPASVTIADGSGSTTCANAMLSAPSGGSTITFSDGELGATSSCTVTVNVTSSTVGTHMNTSGDLTYTQSTGPNNSGTASDDLTVETSLPAFSKSFSPDPIGLNGTSTLTLTIDNSANGSNVLNLDFTDTLPPGLQVASPANASTTCGDPLIPAVLTATPGSSTIILDSDGFLGFPAVASGASCTVIVDIKGTSVGMHTNVVELLVDGDSAGFASDALTVNGSPSSLLITKEFTDDPAFPGGTVTLDFTLTNSDRDFSATGIAFTDNLAGFSPALSTGAEFTSTLLNTCGGSLTGAGGTTITFSGGSLGPSGSCTISTSLTIPGDASQDTYTNTSSAVTGTIDGNPVAGNTASDNLTVFGAEPLTFTKAFQTDPVAGGDSVDLEFTITNPNPANGGSADASDISFSDNLSAFLSGTTVTALPATGSCGPGSTFFVAEVIGEITFFLDGGSVDEGSFCTFTITILIPASAESGTHINTTSNLTATMGGADPSYSLPATDSLSVNSGASLNFLKEFIDDPVNAGGQATLRFTIESGLESAVDVADVTFTDDLDAMLTGVAAAGLPLNGVCGDGTLSGTTTITLTGATLSPGEVCVFDVPVDIPGGAASGDYENETSALSGTAQTDPTAPASAGPANDTLTVYGTDDAPVVLTKEFTDDPVLPGGTVTLEFTITNPNNADATSISFSDNLNNVLPGSPNLTVDSFPPSPCGGTLSEAGAGFLIFSGGSLAAAGMPGDSCTFSVDLTVPTGVADDSYQNTTSAPTSNFATGDPAIDFLVIDSAVLTFTKSFTDDPVKPGDDATLLFTITNPLGVEVTEVAFTDELSDMLPGALFDSGVGNTCGVMPTPGSSLIDISGGTVPANDFCTIEILVSIPPDAFPGDYDNETSTLTGMAGAAAVSAAPARDTLEVEAEFPPTFMKVFDDASPVLSGESVLLTFTISNTDPGNPLGGLAFSDDINTMMLPGATFSGAPPNPCGGSLSVSGGTLLSFSNGTAPAGGDCSFDVTVNVPDAAPALAGDFVNTTSDLNSNGLKQADPASDTLTVTSSADLEISISDSADPVVPGTAMSYTVDVDNLGPQDADNAVVTVTLPVEVTLVSTAGCAEDPNGVTTCSLGNIVSGGSASFTIDVNVNPDATSAFDTDVSVSADPLDPVMGNDDATETTDVAPEADISVTKDDGVTEVSAGGSVTYTIVATNNGPSDDPMVSVTDTFPADLTGCSFTSAAAGGATGNTDAAGDIGDTLSMPVGSSATYTATCTVDVAASGDLVNTTDVAGSFDSNAGNDSATDTDTINPAILDFSKAFAPGTIFQGQETVLTFTIDNTGNVVDATGMAFDDPLPPGVTVSNSTPADNGCGGTFTAATGADTVTLVGGSVDAGDFCEISVTLVAVEVGAQLNETSLLTSSLPDAGPATDTLTVNQAGAPLFSKVFNPDPISQGAETVLTFTIDNSTNGIEAAMLTFDDDLAPFGIVVADAPMIDNGCLGTFTADPGTSTVDLADGTVAAGEIREISVTLRALDAGIHDNVTSALSSTLPEALPATDTLTVNQAGAPLFSKAFVPETIDQGAETVLTFTIDNSTNAIEAAMLAFDDDLAPFGIVVADDPMIDNGCLGTFTADPGTSTVDLADGAVAAGEICEISVTLRALDAGIHDNTTSPLTSTLLEAPAAMATLTVTAAEAPLFSKAFAPDTIDQGSETDLIFTIDNSANAIEAAMLDFDDPLPPGVLVAGSPNASNACGGTFTAASGADTVDLADGTVAAGAVCEISVRVRAFEFGDRLNTTSLLGSSLGDAPAATATLTVNALPPGFSKAFTPDTIVVTGISTLAFLIDNTAASIPATDLDFTDVLPDDLVIGAVPNASSGCGGGTITAPAGGSTIAYSGGTVAAFGRCVISVDVTSEVPGSYPNTSGDLTSSLGNSGTASATLTVEAAQVGTITILQFTDADGNYSFASDEPNLNFIIPTEDGFGSIGPITLPAGSYTVTQSRPDGVGNLEVFCSDDDSFGVRRTGVLTLNILPLEAVTCTFLSIETAQKTIDVINRLLALRANLILSNQPELARRLERLTNGFGSSSPVTFSNGDLGAMTPFTFNPLSLGSGQYRFSTSLAQVERAAASIALAHGDIAARRFVENRRFDVWVELSYQKFDDNAANDGHFGIAFTGVDYLFTEDLLIGAVLQIDDMKDSDDATNSTVSGLGWMFGPYVTARVAPNLYFDARLAYGRSTNEVSPFNTYTDTFDGERWLVSAGLTGEFKKGPWTIRPSANLSYFEETQAGYVDSLGATIPSQTVALGQIQIGPTISGRFETANGVIYQPSLTIDGIYNFGETRGVTVTNPDTPHTEGFRARIKAGVNFTNEMGTRIGISGIYDGIGQSDFESLGLSFDLNIPLYKAKAR